MIDRRLPLAALALIAALAAGCSQQEPAERAVDAAEDALAAVSETALKYVPDQYGEAKATLDKARKALQDGKYAEAIAAAKDLPARAQQIGAAAFAARDTVTAEIKVYWEGLAATMPGKLSALEARIDELGKSKRLPKGVERSTLEAARSGLGVAAQAWAEAEAAHEAGNLEGAVARGQETERLIAELMQSTAPDGPAPPAG